LFNHT
jgi:hypothetical protein